MDKILKTNEENNRALHDVYNENSYTKKRTEDIIDSRYEVNSENNMRACSESSGNVRHEMALEVGVLDYIQNKKTDVYGEWDYLTHQVIASPF